MVTSLCVPAIKLVLSVRLKVVKPLSKGVTTSQLSKFNGIPFVPDSSEGGSENCAVPVHCKLKGLLPIGLSMTI